VYFFELFFPIVTYFSLLVSVVFKQLYDEKRVHLQSLLDYEARHKRSSIREEIWMSEVMSKVESLTK